MTGVSVFRTLFVLTAVAALGACSAGSGGYLHDPSEGFSVAKYGPAASRVVAFGDPVPKGGGHYMVGEPYRIAGKTYIPREDPKYSQVGIASWYGMDFHGRETANGEIYDVDAVTAAHPTMPLPSYARVTNLDNGRSITVRVNDRGPFADNRVIDVSRTVSRMLDFEDEGTAKVKVDYIGPAPIEGSDDRTLVASYRGPGSAPATVSSGPVLVAQAQPALLPKPTPAVVLQPAPTPAPRAASPLPPNDPLAPLIMRAGLSGLSYSRAPGPSPAQEAADALARPDLSAQLAVAAAKKAAELGLRGGITP